MHKATPITYKASASALKQTTEGGQKLVEGTRKSANKFQSYKVDPKNEKKKELDIEPELDQAPPSEDPPTEDPPTTTPPTVPGSVASGQGGGDGEKTEDIDLEKEKNDKAVSDLNSVISDINLTNLF
jgi:hypothetical protein